VGGRPARGSVWVVFVILFCRPSTLRIYSVNGAHDFQAPSQQEKYCRTPTPKLRRLHRGKLFKQVVFLGDILRHQLSDNFWEMFLAPKLQWHGAAGVTQDGDKKPMLNIFAALPSSSGRCWSFCYLPFLLWCVLQFVYLEKKGFDDQVQALVYSRALERVFALMWLRDPPYLVSDLLCRSHRIFLHSMQWAFQPCIPRPPPPRAQARNHCLPRQACPRWGRGRGHAKRFACINHSDYVSQFLLWSQLSRAIATIAWNRIFNLRPIVESLLSIPLPLCRRPRLAAFFIASYTIAVAGWCRHLSLPLFLSGSLSPSPLLGYFPVSLCILSPSWGSLLSSSVSLFI